MTKQIWKFPIKGNSVIIEVPIGAEILTAQLQNGLMCIWMLVSTENQTEERHFEVFATGQHIPVDMGIERKYISTVQLEQGSLVFHVFERL